MAPKGLGRGPDGNFFAFSAALLSTCQPSLINKGPKPGSKADPAWESKSAPDRYQNGGGDVGEKPQVLLANPFTPPAHQLIYHRGVRVFTVQLLGIYSPQISTLGDRFGHPLNYRGAGIRTERFRTKPIAAPKGFGRGPIVNSSASSASFFFPSRPFLITGGQASGPSDSEQNR